MIYNISLLYYLLLLLLSYCHYYYYYYFSSSSSLLLIFEIFNFMLSDWILFLAYANLFRIKDLL
jgi:hypothetical protein